MQHHANEIIFKHIENIQVRFTDVDMMGHVTNSVHLAYADIGRMHYFNTVLRERIDNSAESLVVASVKVDFKKPIYLDEEISILTKTIKLGNKSLHMLQHLVAAQTGEIKSELLSVIAGFNYEKQYAIVIPDRWKQLIAAYDCDVEYKYVNGKLNN